MTGPRQERKPFGASAILIGIALAGLAALAPLPGRAATTEWVVVDRNTGLAIGGVDPVAYFADGEVKIGQIGRAHV